MTAHDIRICLFGDSFAIGVGDPACLGWVGRLAKHMHSKACPLTIYNLGVRGNTSADVLARFDTEATPRVRPDTDTRVIVSVGVNDTVLDDRFPRVAPEQSTANLTAIIGKAARRGLPLLVVGPPPIADDGHNARIADLNQRYSRLCGQLAVPFVDVYRPLIDSSAWMTEVRQGDGAHPGAAGYQVLADLAFKPWSAWLALTN
jgi:acyl-CoA thioesterase-1